MMCCCPFEYFPTPYSVTLTEAAVSLPESLAVITPCPSPYNVPSGL